jgi:glycosyltransferase involved in cell wall biosynthesis
MTPGGYDLLITQEIAAQLRGLPEARVLREILEDWLTALLFDPLEVGAWVAAVIRLRDDVGLRTRLGSRGRVVHSERSTWEVRTDRLLNLGMHQRG